MDFKHKFSRKDNIYFFKIYRILGKNTEWIFMHICIIMQMGGGNLLMYNELQLQKKKGCRNKKVGQPHLKNVG